MTVTCDVAIIGAGPAGLSTADTLVGHGLDIRLLDENRHAGGQLLRRPPQGFDPSKMIEMDNTRRRGFRLMDRLAGNGILIEQGGRVLGIYPENNLPENNLLVQSAEGRVFDMTAKYIVCATGARERFIPFPGWTLPGVISAGAAQILLKNSGMLKDADIILGGSGPMPYLVGRQVMSSGGNVVAILDQSGIKEKLYFAKSFLRYPGKLIDGALTLASLLGSGVNVHFGHSDQSRWCIIKAEGSKRLERITASRLDQRGRVVPRSEKHYGADFLAVGFGFVPNIELLLQAGCEALYSTDRGGWVIQTDESLETSLANIFAVGEVTGIAGGSKSLIEGRICGLSILEKFGKTGGTSKRQYNRLIRQRHHEMTFGSILNRMCRIPKHWVLTIPDDTIICRCEDIRMGEVKKRIADGFVTAGALKKATRCGMGNCQGRICSTIVQDIIDVLADDESRRQEPPSTRSPVKCVPLNALAEM